MSKFNEKQIIWAGIFGKCLGAKDEMEEVIEVLRSFYMLRDNRIKSVLKDYEILNKYYFLQNKSAFSRLNSVARYFKMKPEAVKARINRLNKKVTKQL